MTGSHEDCSACFYCDQPFPKVGGEAAQHEHDHFPVPKQCGGMLTVPTCERCHTLKDRIPMDRWGLEGFAELWASWHDMTPVARIFVAKVVRVHFQLQQRDLAEAGVSSN